MNSPKTILIEARKLIESGWIKGKFESNDGKCFCAVGAVKKAAQNCTTEDDYEKEEMRARRILNPIVSTKNGGVVDFNDDPKTTKKDVLAMFDLAIELCKEEN